MNKINSIQILVVIMRPLPYILLVIFLLQKGNIWQEVMIYQGVREQSDIDKNSENRVLVRVDYQPKIIMKSRTTQIHIPRASILVLLFFLLLLFQQLLMSQQIVEANQQNQQNLNKYNLQYEQAVGKLKQLHSDIGAKFVKLDELKQQFVHIKQKKFVKTLISIMDKLSTQLIETTKATQTIDKEINSDPQCVYLQKELSYFQRHKQSTEASIKSVKQQILLQFRRNKLISQQRQALHGQLYKQTARQHKYTNKANSLAMRRQSLKGKLECNIRPQTATQRQNSSKSERMGKRNFSFQQKMSSSKARELAKIHTAITEKQTSRPYIKSCRLQ